MTLIITTHHIENQKKSDFKSHHLVQIYNDREATARAVYLNFWEVHEIMLALHYAGYDRALTELFDEIFEDMRKEVKSHGKKKI